MCIVNNGWGACNDYGINLEADIKPCPHKIKSTELACSSS